MEQALAQMAAGPHDGFLHHAYCDKAAKHPQEAQVSMVEIFQELEDSSCPASTNLLTVNDQVQVHLATINTGVAYNEKVV